MTKLEDFLDHIHTLGVPSKEVESAILHTVFNCIRVMGQIDESKLRDAYLEARDATTKRGPQESEENFIERKQYLEMLSLINCTALQHIAIQVELGRVAKAA